MIHRDISLAIQAIVNGGIYLFENLVNSFVTVTSAILLGTFEIYADFALTAFKLVRNGLIMRTSLRFLFEPFVRLIAYMYILPAAQIATVYTFLVVFVRPYLKKPFDYNIPIPDKPPAILVDDKKEFGEHYYEQLKGIKLHYVKKLPKDAQGNDTNDYEYLIVFLHGFGGFWFSWRNQIEYLSDFPEFATVAVDLRGYGRSEKPDGVRSYTLDKLVEDLGKLLEKINPDRKKVILVGHSWGGILTYEFILTHCSRIHKYVTIGAPPPYALNITSKQIVQLWYAYFYLLPVVPEKFLESTNLKWFDELYKTSLPDVIEAYKYTYAESGSFTPPLNYYRANFVKLFEYVFYGIKDVNVINKPGLAIYGDKDGSIDRDVYKHGYKVRDLTVKEVHGDHYCHENPYSADDVSMAIIRFIDPTVKLPDNLLLLRANAAPPTVDVKY